jgi:hypothetical protein
MFCWKVIQVKLEKLHYDPNFGQDIMKFQVMKNRLS